MENLTMLFLVRLWYQRTCYFMLEFASGRFVCLVLAWSLHKGKHWLRSDLKLVNKRSSIQVYTWCHLRLHSVFHSLLWKSSRKAECAPVAKSYIFPTFCTKLQSVWTYTGRIWANIKNVTHIWTIYTGFIPYINTMLAKRRGKFSF